MSDAFVVISEDGTIADLNKTFIEKFKDLGEIKNKDNLFHTLENAKTIDLKTLKEHIEEAREHEINRKFDRLMRGMKKSAWRDIDL